MAVNYTAYPAWNDPYNPWLRFTSVTLSGSYVDDSSVPFNVNTTLTLSTFNPADGNIAVYVNQDFSFNLILNNTNEWYFTKTNGLASFTRLTTTRAVPGGGNLSANGWENTTGTGVNTLSLTINRGYTQWEKRRRRLLGYR